MPSESHQPQEVAPDLPPEQVTARMNAALRRAHTMPVKEQKDMKLSKPGGARKQITK